MPKVSIGYDECYNMDKKCCRLCNSILPIEEFYKYRSGHDSRCKNCFSKIAKHRRKIATRLCNRCEVFKPVIEFRGSKHHLCKDCSKLIYRLCSVEGCQEKHYSNGMCKTHLYRFKRHGDVQAHIPIRKGYPTGLLSRSWRGGESRLRNGRVLIYAPGHPKASSCGLYVLRYVLIVEKHLGRFLNDDEIVHHINGDHTDDRLENLQVMTRGEHNKVHYKGRKYFKIYR